MAVAGLPLSFRLGNGIFSNSTPSDCPRTAPKHIALKNTPLVEEVTKVSPV